MIVELAYQSPRPCGVKSKKVPDPVPLIQTALADIGGQPWMAAAELAHCAAESAAKTQRTSLSEQREKHLQTVLIEAAKLAPRFSSELKAVHERELLRGSRNCATPAVARKLAAYLLAVDRSGEPFAPRTRAAGEKSKIPGEAGNKPPAGPPGPGLREGLTRKLPLRLQQLAAADGCLITRRQSS